MMSNFFFFFFFMVTFFLERLGIFLLGVKCETKTHPQNNVFSSGVPSAVRSQVKYVARHPMVYFHIPKAGGTSMREMLFRSLPTIPEENVFYPCHKRRCTATIQEESLSADYVYILAHVQRPELLRHLSQKYNLNVTIKEIHCLTVLREPYERLVSSYYHFEYDKIGLPFHQYVEKNVSDFLSGNLNVATLWLGPTSKEAFETIDHCVTGVTEHMEEFLRILPTTPLKLNLKELHVNAAPVHHKPSKLDFSPSLRSLLTRHLQQDYALWHRANQSFFDKYITQKI